MKIRKATLLDLKFISNLDSFWNINQFEEEFSNSFSSIYVIENEYEIIGFVCVRLMDNICDIMNIAVCSKFQNKGIGTKLLSYILNTIQCVSFNLEVSTNNIYAIKLYEKLGFDIIHTRKNYYKDFDALIMQKTL